MIVYGLWIAGLFLAAGAVCGMIRLVRGPYLVDRVVSLDYLTVTALGALGLFGLFYAEPLYLDVAITLALSAFIATIAFARYAEVFSREGERRGDRDVDD